MHTFKNTCLTASESRRADALFMQKHRVASVDLMETAGQAAFEMIKKKFPQILKSKVLVVCGKGNNAGDGLVVARALRQAGSPVCVCLMTSPQELSADSAVMLGRYEKLSGDIVELPTSHLSHYAYQAHQGLKSSIQKFDMIIDAMFGTGLSRKLQKPWTDVIQAINESGKRTISLDIPSGLSADTGEVLGAAVKAALTVTMGRPKVGFFQSAGPRFVGALEVVGIGIPDSIYEDVLKTRSLTVPTITSVDTSDIRALFERRDADTHKGTYGHVLMVGGEKIGAILLSGRAALRTGSGLVTVALRREGLKKISKNFLELMYETWPTAKAFEKLLENKKALAIGPGLGVGAPQKALLQKILNQKNLPVVLDADALNIIAKNKTLLKKKKCAVVITPHPAEMARLVEMSTAQVQSHRVEVARDFAQKYGVFVVLKGHQSVIATPAGDIFINSTGNPGMATAGMGDVLTGVITSLLGQCLDVEKAVVAGVWIHGRTGDRVAQRLGDRGLLASDLIDEIPLVFKELFTKSSEIHLSFSKEV